MEMILILLVFMAVAGVCSQIIGLIFYFIYLKKGNENHKETSLQCLVVGTGLLIGSGVVCGLTITAMG